MQAWREFMPPGMLMRSEAFASNLYTPQRGYTIKDYCRQKGMSYQPVGMHLPLETFVDYALWFQANLVSHVRQVDVVNLQRTDGLFHLSLTDGSALTARRVVIALGLKGFAKMPSVLESQPRQYVSHSDIYGPLTWANRKDIAIIGGGQSALGLAALLHEVGARVRVFARESSVTWNAPPVTERGWISKLLTPEGGIGAGWRSYILSEYPFFFHALGARRRKEFIEKSWGPSGAWWLHDRVVDKIEVRTGSHLRHASIENDRLLLRFERESKESCVSADHVIAATGFKVDIRRHTFISKEIVDAISVNDGAPELTANFETSVRGIYVIGPASAYSFGPAMRFVYGAKYASPRVAWHIGNLLRKELKRGPSAVNERVPGPEVPSTFDMES
jgi:cation diffusion facilitator CzcD-associated flavoprotein CzcO